MEGHAVIRMNEIMKIITSFSEECILKYFFYKKNAYLL